MSIRNVAKLTDVRASRGRSSRSTDAAGEVPPAPRTTTVVYLIALTLIAALSITSYVLTNHIVDRQQGTALLINTAERQRTLSQRITRVAEEVADGTLEPSAGRAELLALADRMEQAQHQLLDGDVTLGMPPARSRSLRTIYFDSPLRLAQQVNVFLAETRAFAKNPAVTLADPDLRAMIAGARAPLPEGLNTAVSQYQAESEHDIRRLDHMMTTSTATMLVVLVLEALLIYRPLFHRLTGAISMLVKTSTTDFLTGSLNRRAFLALAERELARSARLQQPTCLLMADIDRFKVINDTYGHAAGDLVIKHFAGVVQSYLRLEDSVGRIGGEEFGILLPSTNLQGAMLAAERIRERFANTTAAVTPHAQRILATVSLGVVCVTGGSATDLLSQADQLLYRAKEAGRNRVESGMGASVTDLGIDGAAAPDLAH